MKNYHIVAKVWENGNGWSCATTVENFENDIMTADEAKKLLAEYIRENCSNDEEDPGTDVYYSLEVDTKEEIDGCWSSEEIAGCWLSDIEKEELQ